MSKMVKIIGIDNGFKFTKTSELDTCFGSTIINKVDNINDVIQCGINGVNYVVGEENGHYIADADKLKTDENKENLKVCTLTAIGLSYPREAFITAKIVVGVPVSYYDKQRVEFKDMMMKLNDNIFINKVGFEQTIKINDVLVYPQSAGWVFVNPERSKNSVSLIIDIGGGTWDVSLFHGLKMVKHKTYRNGMKILDSILAQYLNTNYYTNYSEYQIHGLRKKGMFTVDGQKVSIDVLDEPTNEFIIDIMGDLKTQFNPESADNVILIGGGAEVLENNIREYIPHIEVEPNAQFKNAMWYKKMGEMQWSKTKEE
ncbi:ParM/StbA family protein [Clostridium botulinum]|uniref:Chaperone protein DnaK n=1 Tax=Clostridium botulinum TaxID=1491 RepID=A0A6M0SQW9_CLOBO|nr:ParM/StbA family protein [Clostridium botulinum]NFO35113.1 ParM/StbA family protein [Clostridium botulinum]NFO48358.1 ParM/StbA family protein [Clostridium botulinum]